MGLSCPFGIACFLPAKVKFFGVIFWPYNKPFIDQACLVKMAGYWPCSFLLSLTCQKKKLANIQPSWPHACMVNNIHLFLNTSYTLIKNTHLCIIFFNCFLVFKSLRKHLGMFDKDYYIKYFITPMQWHTLCFAPRKGSCSKCQLLFICYSG